MVGPTDDGKFRELTVCSIQRNRSGCRVLRAGQAATLALGDFDRSLLRKVSISIGGCRRSRRIVKIKLPLCELLQTESELLH